MDRICTHKNVVNSNQGAEGFTLIELIIVIAIVSIVSVTALPDFIGLSDRARLKSVARDVVSDMQRIRTSAIRDRSTWAIHFDIANDRYRILNGDGGDSDWTNGNESEFKTVSLTDTTGISYGNNFGDRPDEPDPGAGDGVSFASNVVVFKSNGTSLSGTVYLKNVDGDTFAVGSNSAAGRVKAWHNYGAGWGS